MKRDPKISLLDVLESVEMEKITAKKDLPSFKEKIKEILDQLE